MSLHFPPELPAHFTGCAGAHAPLIVMRIWRCSSRYILTWQVKVSMSTVSQASICVTRGLKVYPKGGETVRPDGPRATYMSKGTSVPLALGQCLLMILASIGGSNIMKNSHCQVPLLNSCILTLFLLNCYLVSLSWGRRGNIYLQRHHHHTWGVDDKPISHCPDGIQKHWAITWMQQKNLLLSHSYSEHEAKTGFGDIHVGGRKSPFFSSTDVLV